MDVTLLKEKAMSFIKKYRYPMLVLLLGIVFMMLPSKQDVETQQQPVSTQQQQTQTTEEKLSIILSRIDGVGEVQVLLTESAGTETIYQTDASVSTNDSNSNTQSDTVTITDAQRNEIGLVKQTNPPIYLGAIVLCGGADSPTVRLSIVDAVSKVTGLGADKISVLKMK